MRNFARRLAIFKYMKDYYPITLVKTSELDPQKNYIFGYHPHGFFTEGASIGFGTDACGFGEKFRGITNVGPVKPTTYNTATLMVCRT